MTVWLDCNRWAHTTPSYSQLSILENFGVLGVRRKTADVLESKTTDVVVTQRMMNDSPSGN